MVRYRLEGMARCPECGSMSLAHALDEGDRLLVRWYGSEDGRCPVCLEKPTCPVPFINNDPCGPSRAPETPEPAQA